MQRVTFKASRAGRSMQRRYLCGQMGRRGGQQGCRTFATDWPGQCIFWWKVKVILLVFLFAFVKVALFYLLPEVAFIVSPTIRTGQQTS